MEKAAEEQSGAVQEAHFEASVGDDGIPRRIAITLSGEPEEGDRDKVDVDLEFKLSAVNEAPPIETPSGGESIYAWFQQQGLAQFEVSILFSQPDPLRQMGILLSNDIRP